MDYDWWCLRWCLETSIIRVGRRVNSPARNSVEAKNKGTSDLRRSCVKKVREGVTHIFFRNCINSKGRRRPGKTAAARPSRGKGKGSECGTV